MVFIWTFQFIVLTQDKGIYDFYWTKKEKEVSYFFYRRFQISVIR